MANISLKSMLEASIDPKLVARSKKTGKLVYFKTPDAKAAAVKSGSHEEPKKDKKAQAKQAAKSADLFKGDYDKERGGYGSKPGPAYKNPLKSKEDWDDLRSIYGGDVYDADGNVIKNPFETGDDFSDIKGPKPGDSNWSTKDVFNATFKDPETGKEITVGDAYDREDDSPAYEKALDYVSQFNPDDEKVMVGPGSKDDSDWMDDLDSIDTSDIKGKADPDADSFKHDDVYGATFKDPETGKTITVGDAYDREDDSEAYKKAFAYVSKFDPDKEAVIAGPGSDSQKDTSKVNFPKKASELSYKHSNDIQNTLDSNSGLKGIAQMNDNGAIEYTASSGEEPTYGLFIGPNDDYGKPDEYRVSLESIYGNDPSNLSGKNDKSFKSAKDAMVYMTALAKKYKKELQMDDGKNESTKLTSMIKK